MMRVTLVGLTLCRPGGERLRYSLAPAYLKAYAQAQPELAGLVAIRTLDYQLRDWSSEDLDAAVEEILADEPALVGFSCYMWNIQAVLELSRRLKTRWPGVKIAFGGPEAAPRARELLRDRPELDFVCLGEGERTFAELLERLRGDADVAGVRGLAWRKGAAIVVEGPRDRLDDLDLIPSPFLKGLIPFGAGDMIVIETSRGCPYGCRFCDWQNGQATRDFPVERVLAEIESVLAKEENLTFVFADADVFTDLPRAKRLLSGLRRIIELKPGASFFFQSYLPRMDEETFRLLNARNFACSAGVQSTNPAALKATARFFDKAKVERAVGAWRREAPLCFLSMHLLYGLPGESVESFREGLQWALDQRPSMIDVMRTCVLPGAEFGRHPEEFGLVCEEEPPYRVLKTREAPAHQIEALERFAFRFFLLNNVPSLGDSIQRLAGELGVKSLAVWDELIGRLERGPDFGLAQAYAEADPFDSGFINASLIWQRRVREDGTLRKLRDFVAEFGDERLYSSRS